MTNVKQTVTALDTALSELTDRLIQAQRRVADLEQAAERTSRRLARGTDDLTELANRTVIGLDDAEDTLPGKRVIPPAPAPDVAARLEAALRKTPLSVTDAADALGVPVAHVAIALRTLKKAGRVFNVGTSDQPLWTWVIGDSASTAELMVEVERLLKMPRAWSLQELSAATGCGHNRISGVRVRLMKAGLPVRNLGNNWRGRWTANPKAR